MRYHCKVLTPLHVGTGQTLLPLEYLSDGFFAVVNQEALFRAAPEVAENLTRQLAVLTPEEIQRRSLTQILPAPLRSRQDFYHYRCTLAPHVKVQLDRARERGQAEVRIAIKTPDERPYLPGTSLKGALRTALVYTWIKGDANALAALKGAPTREKWRTVEGLLRAGGSQDVTRDVLRTLEVSDSTPLPVENCLAIAHEAVLSAAVRRSSNAPGDAPAAWKGFPTFLETIQPEAGFEGRIVLRDRLLLAPAAARLGWAPRQRRLSLAEIVAAANLLAGDVIAWEQRYLARVTGSQVDTIRAFYRDLAERVQSATGNECYLCVGRGAGWHKSTVGLLLQQAEDFDFARFRRDGGTAERRGPGFDRTDFEFPKTRKFIMEGGGKPLAPLGWVRLVLSDLPTQARVAAEPTTATPVERAAAPHVERLAPQETERPPRGAFPTGGPTSAPVRPPQAPKAAKLTDDRPKPSKTTKASEKAKRAQQQYLRRLRGEEDPQ